jgi:hypothetical protein
MHDHHDRTEHQLVGRIKQVPMWLWHGTQWREENGNMAHLMEDMSAIQWGYLWLGTSLS